jgi:hypothetical protein
MPAIIRISETTTRIQMKLQSGKKMSSRIKELEVISMVGKVTQNKKRHPDHPDAFMQES